MQRWLKWMLKSTVVRGQRDEFAAGLDAGMLAVYEKTLAKRGVGAARLFHGTSEGSGMQLSPGDLAEIKAAAEDDIVFCPDSGCILVRSAEWAAAPTAAPVGRSRCLYGRSKRHLLLLVGQDDVQGVGFPRVNRPPAPHPTFRAWL